MAASAAMARGAEGQAEARWVGNGHASAERPGTESAAEGPWESALRARSDFEAEPQGTHTKVEYARVMDGFRVIYHGDPSDAHAARAVMQVAELLAEQGRELNDRKSLRAAAGQYEFLAKAYPGGNLAPVALGQALDLLGPRAADDSAEAAKVRVEIEEDYPRSAAAKAARAGGAATVDASADRPAAGSRDSPLSRGQGKPSSGSVGSQGEPAPAVGTEAVAAAGQSAVDATPPSQNRDRGHPAPTSEDRDVAHLANAADEKPMTGPLAVVTGIRHWSTASYTRVAIDLSVNSEDGVKYQAARVENPDRIYFDLHHAKLVPQLVGKSFTVTDDGFLTKIRAAQFTDEVTRVVLDVHAVAEYSAFLLPNPYRLIIDIHGRAANAKQEAENSQQPANSVAPKLAPRPDVAEEAPPMSRDGGMDPAAPRPMTSGAAASGAAANGAVQSSSLPPMPVTDGSAAFGLTPRSSAAMPMPAGQGQPVARPRVVVSSKPTAAKPVPNTVTSRSTETGAQFGTEVAAVSEQPGRVEATRRPTSQPIVSRSGETDAANREQEPADGGPPSGAETHYVPRSTRAGTARTMTETAGVVQPTLPPRDAGPAADGKSGSRRRSTGHSASAAARADSAPALAAPPTADGETSMMRALGLKIGRIVIDAGHGGHDSGTLGADGIEEKDVVLDVALRLGKLLHDRLGAEIVYTRADDTFIPLETRTAIANKAQADLFISVHANSSSDESARGVEVYYLNFTSDPDAMRVAARENAVSTQSVHELSDLVKKIALKDKIEESRELASDVDASLFAGLTKGNSGLKNRGAKKAPFVVLIGANMPSILAEISFVTNPQDADELERPAYRERVAESLYGGVARYAAGINGSRPRVRTTEQAAR